MTGTTFEGLGRYLETELERVEEALSRAVAALEGRMGGPGSDPAQPGRDPAGSGTDSVLEAIRHGVLSGGKRLRPILCVAAYRACDGGQSEVADMAGSDAIYDLAVSLEMIHAYSLMHDDLPCMDDAELRRGRPTTHRAHGEETTIVAGAMLIPLAALQALDACHRLGCPAATGRRVAGHLMEASGAGGMVGGQWLDLNGEGEALGPEALSDLHRRKTGALLAASLWVGATAAGAADEVLEALEEYGRSVGLAFQIADDILDATQTAAALGKNPSDTDLEKSTYVSLYGLEEAGRQAEARVEEALGALDRAGLTSPALVALARYVVERDR